MKRTVKSVLCELLKDASRSDRELAKSLRVSQPTVSRVRNKLVENGLIRQFTVIPDFNALGFEILAITSFTSKDSKETHERVKKWAASKPNILFAAAAQGKGRNELMISLHKNYSEYHSFISEVKGLGREAEVSGYDTLLVSLKGPIVKSFSLKYLAEVLQASKD